MPSEDGLLKARRRARLQGKLLKAIAADDLGLAQKLLEAEIEPSLKHPGLVRGHKVPLDEKSIEIMGRFHMPKDLVAKLVGQGPKQFRENLSRDRALKEAYERGFAATVAMAGGVVIENLMEGDLAAAKWVLKNAVGLQENPDSPRGAALDAGETETAPVSVPSPYTLEEWAGAFGSEKDAAALARTEKEDLEMGPLESEG